jgi:UDP-glucuronate 4-epimerase
MINDSHAYPQSVLVTGAAGFIGYHLCSRLLQEGCTVHGLDNLNSYYDPRLKAGRLQQLEASPGFKFRQVDISDVSALNAAFAWSKPDVVVNLAAQAGVRYSLDNPWAYNQSNIAGFLGMLEGARQHGARHLFYASSSSVYGANREIPYREDHATDRPVSYYAATKKANEAMAHAYSEMHGMHCTGFRFFTAYGPWGRPDMAYYKFTTAILRGEAIKLYNNGDMARDFTYIDDIIEGVVRLIARRSSTPAKGGGDHSIYNIGNHSPVRLGEFVALLEKTIGQPARIEYLPMQPGEVLSTYADISKLTRDTGFTPATGLEAGLERFYTWYRDYHAR